MIQLHLSLCRLRAHWSALVRCALPRVRAAVSEWGVGDAWLRCAGSLFPCAGVPPAPPPRRVLTCSNQAVGLLLLGRSRASQSRWARADGRIGAAAAGCSVHRARSQRHEEGVAQRPFAAAAAARGPQCVHIASTQPRSPSSQFHSTWNGIARARRCTVVASPLSHRRAS